MSCVVDKVIKKKSPSFAEPDLEKPNKYQVFMSNESKVSAMLYQISILKSVFNLNRKDMVKAVLQAQFNSKAVVFIGGREIAEMKAYQAETMKQKYLPMSDSLKKIGFVFDKM